MQAFAVARRTALYLQRNYFASDRLKWSCEAVSNSPLEHSILESLEDGVVVVDGAGNVEFANGAARKLFGDAVDVRLGMDRRAGCGIFCFDGSNRRLPDARLPLSRALAGESVRGEDLIVENELHPSARRLKVTAFPRFNSTGRRDGAVALYRHIPPEQPKPQSDVLQGSDDDLRRFQAVFDNALDAVVLADNEMRFVEVNPSACALLGYPRDEFLQRHVQDITPPEHRDAAQQQWVEFVQRGRAEGEMILVGRNGTTINVEYRAVASILPGIHLSVLRDITGRKLAEAALTETQRTESIGVLAGAAAHDFNNLLVGIIGNACLALERRPFDLETATLIRDILTAGERAALLTRQMLTYGGKAPVFREAINLKHFVGEIAPLIQTAIPRQIRVSYDLHEVRPIEASPVQVQQVIMNLMINAGQAIFEQSPGEIWVRTRARTLPDPDLLEANSLAPGEYVAVEVEDTGRGIDENLARRMFEPFFTTKVRGKGLGLATVRGIVRDHGGAIWVRSTPGHGACFTVLFPVTLSGVASEPNEQSEDMAAAPARILILDDEPVVQRMAKNALEASGHAVSVVSDARDAASLLSSPAGSFDALLLEVSFPSASLKDLRNCLAALPRSLKIIVFSAQPEDEVQRILGGLETDCYVQKPCTPIRLRRAVQTALGR